MQNAERSNALGVSEAHVVKFYTVYYICVSILLLDFFLFLG